MIKEFKGIFKPEIQPWHKVEFSVATELELEGADLQKAVIPAGTLLKSKTDTSEARIELTPKAGAKIASVADAAKPLAVLMHDVVVEKGVTKYPVGVIIKGVVYDDVMTEANTSTNWTDAVKKAMLPNITTYGVKTLNK